MVLDGNPLAGALFETAVIAAVRKLAASMASPSSMYHWRSGGGAEVDLLLERDGVFHPIEVKLASQPTRRDVRGMASFREAYPELKIAPGLVIPAAQKFWADIQRRLRRAVGLGVASASSRITGEPEP